MNISPSNDTDEFVVPEPGSFTIVRGDEDVSPLTVITANWPVYSPSTSLRAIRGALLLLQPVRDARVTNAAVNGKNLKRVIEESDKCKIYKSETAKLCKNLFPSKYCVKKAINRHFLTMPALLMIHFAGGEAYVRLHRPHAGFHNCKKFSVGKLNEFGKIHGFGSECGGFRRQPKLYVPAEIEAGSTVSLIDSLFECPSGEKPLR